MRSALNWWEAIILGLVQGLTEFLPVSSSGHLTLGGALLGLSESHLVFDIAVHVATLLVVVVYYRSEIAIIARSCLARLGATSLMAEPGQIQKDVHFFVAMIIASLPTAVLGLGIKKLGWDDVSTPGFASAMLLVTGGLLFSLRYVGEGGCSTLSYRNAFLIGCIQGCAVLPGISRSGATIALALWLGIERDEAAKFSFLLSIPAILGAALLQILDVLEVGHGVDWSHLLAGGLAAAISGGIAIGLLIPMIRKGYFTHFCWYVIPVGLMGLLWLS